jgi:hypothetical protein
MSERLERLQREIEAERALARAGGHLMALNKTRDIGAFV